MREGIKTTIYILLLLLGLAVVLWTRFGYQTNYLDTFR
jgi:hypothetical protein